MIAWQCGAFRNHTTSTTMLFRTRTRKHDETSKAALCCPNLVGWVREPGAGRCTPGGHHLEFARLHAATHSRLYTAEPDSYRPYLYALAVCAEPAELVEPASHQPTALAPDWRVTVGPYSNTAIAPHSTSGSVTSHPPATERSGSELPSGAT